MTSVKREFKATLSSCAYLDLISTEKPINTRGQGPLPAHTRVFAMFGVTQAQMLRL